MNLQLTKNKALEKLDYEKHFVKHYSRLSMHIISHFRMAGSHLIPYHLGNDLRKMIVVQFQSAGIGGNNKQFFPDEYNTLYVEEIICLILVTLILLRL